jgi:uncharacterized membrane protein
MKTLVTYLINSTHSDMDVQTQLFVSLGYCLLLLVLAIVFKKYPTKEINGLYGYRTTTSMKNKDVWRAANDYSALVFLKICTINFLFPFVGYLLFPKFTVLITVIATTITLLLIILFTEMFLKKNFDKNGNRI